MIKEALWVDVMGLVIIGHHRSSKSTFGAYNIFNTFCRLSISRVILCLLGRRAKIVGCDGMDEWDGHHRSKVFYEHLRRL